VVQATELTGAVDHANSRWSGRPFEAADAVEISDPLFPRGKRRRLDRTWHLPRGSDLPLDRAVDADMQALARLTAKYVDERSGRSHPTVNRLHAGRDQLQPGRVQAGRDDVWEPELRGHTRVA